MTKITAGEIVKFINQLPKNHEYNYINPRNKGKIRIVRVVLPEGPIHIKRYIPSKGETSKSAEETSISNEMIWRIANAFSPNIPINIDRILAASYNTRSAFESLLAYTPQFHYAYPGRIESIRSNVKIKKGHKHLIWTPESPHEEGILQRIETGKVISEIPFSNAVYESLTLSKEVSTAEFDIDFQRRHAQIQIALILIGQQLNYKIWIAQNDKGIEYNQQKLGEMDKIIYSLDNEKILSAYEDAKRAALFIYCIWFRNDRYMPAVFEIEHSTGVTSGLSRMKNFQDKIPPFHSRWVVVASDEDREKVLSEANKEQFKGLDAQYMPYSSVEELYSLCMRRKIKGISDDFLDCFMEPCIKN